MKTTTKKAFHTTDSERIAYIQQRIDNAQTNIQREQLIISSGLELIAKIKENAQKQKSTKYLEPNFRIPPSEINIL